jgi:hypothetical protein
VWCTIILFYSMGLQTIFAGSAEMQPPPNPLLQKAGGINNLGGDKLSLEVVLY